MHHVANFVKLQTTAKRILQPIGKLQQNTSLQNGTISNVLQTCSMKPHPKKKKNEVHSRHHAIKSGMSILGQGYVQNSIFTNFHI